jgi:hypothetical protein
MQVHFLAFLNQPIFVHFFITRTRSLAKNNKTIQLLYRCLSHDHKEALLDVKLGTKNEKTLTKVTIFDVFSWKFHRKCSFCFAHTFVRRSPAPLAPKFVIILYQKLHSSVKLSWKNIKNCHFCRTLFIFRLLI